MKTCEFCGKDLSRVTSHWCAEMNAKGIKTVMTVPQHIQNVRVDVRGSGDLRHMIDPKPGETLMGLGTPAPVPLGFLNGAHDETLLREICERFNWRVDGFASTLAGRIEGHITSLNRAVDLREPVDMILYCPSCGLQHIDAAEEVPNSPIFKSAPTESHPHRMVQTGTFTAQGKWTNPPHRSHLCHGCGHIWRPADIATNGVAVIKTRGSADSARYAPAPKVRYCPECGYIGEVPPSVRDCCPDGSHACMVSHAFLAAIGVDTRALCRLDSKPCALCSGINGHHDDMCPANSK